MRRRKFLVKGPNTGRRRGKLDADNDSVGNDAVDNDSAFVVVASHTLPTSSAKAGCLARVPTASNASFKNGGSHMRNAAAAVKT